MKLPVKAFYDRRTKRDGTNSVNIQYCYSSEKRTVLSTEIFIPLRYWIKKQRIISEKLPLQYGNVQEINGKLLRLIRRVEGLIIPARRYETQTITFLKDYFNSSRSLDKIEIILFRQKDKRESVYRKLDFFFQIDDYIASQSLKVSEFMPAVYRNMKLHLQEFEKFRKAPITFSCLNYDFYEDLLEFLSYHYEHKGRKIKVVGLKRNIAGKTLKQLRIFLNNRIRKNIIPPFDMSGWTVINEEVDTIYLTWDEISAIL